MVFTNIDWIGLVVFVLAAYVQLWGSMTFQSKNEGMSFRERYRKRKARVRFAPPGWLFGIAWFILYGLIAAAGFLYWFQFPTPSTTRDVIFAFYFVNLVLNKMWTPVFFDMDRPGLALINILLVLGTAITVVVLLGVEQAWLPFGLYIAYPIWVLFATYLNWQFWRVKSMEGRAGRALLEDPGDIEMTTMNSAINRVRLRMNR